MSVKNTVNPESLVNVLSSFYRDYVPDKAFINDLMRSFIDTVSLLDDHITTIGKNRVIRNVEIFRKIPFYQLEVTSGLYDVEEMRNKYSTWDSLSVHSKADILDVEGKYELLDASNTWDSDPPRIVSLTIDRYVSPELSKPYVEYLDYLLRNNRLYLFGELARPISTASKSLYLKDISVDVKKAERLWGSMAGLPRSSEMSSTEYPKVVSSVLEAYLGGPTIENLQRTISVVSGLGEDFTIQDRFTPGLEAHRRGQWTNGTLSNFDFLITVPGSYINNQEGLASIRTLINRMKPSYTDFTAIYADSLQDSDVITDSAVVNDSISSGMSESVPFIDDLFLLMSNSSAPIVDTMVSGAPLKLDNAAKLDSSSVLDNTTTGIYDAVTLTYSRL